MATKKYSGAQTGVAVISETMYLKNILLTAGSGADATATLIGNGTNEIVIAAKAGTSVAYPSNGGGSLGLEIIPGPVTITVTGAGSFTRLSY